MIYRYLGNTGLKVSVLSFGNMVAHVANKDGLQFTIDSIKKALSHGINYFDTSEMYGFGEAETLLGHAFKAVGVKREEIVVSSKLYFGTSEHNEFPPHFKYIAEKGQNQIGLSRKHIIEGTKGVLKRLQLEYVDIMFASRPDYITPLEE